MVQSKALKSTTQRTKTVKTTILALTVVLSQLSSTPIKAGELKLSLAPPRPAKIEGRTEFVKFSKLTLLPAPQFHPRFEPERLSWGIPTKTNTPVIPPDPPVNFSLQLPERKYFSNLHYVHKDWRVAGDPAGVDSFGRLWKPPSSKTEIVFPYFRWDYPSRRGERVLAGVMFSWDLFSLPLNTKGRIS